MAPRSPLSQFPEELIILIFEHLDTAPPSERNGRREPSLQLTTTDDIKGHVYKDISRVSRRWRRIVLPLLFRYSRVRLDVEPRGEWLSRTACHQAKGKQPAYSDDMFIRHGGRTGRDGSEDTTPHWALRFHHCLQDYLDFIVGNDLASSIQSFAVLTGPMLLPKQGRFPHRNAERCDLHYQAAADFWYHLYSIIQPPRIVIVAPPADMACLTNACVDTSGDWAFTDMEFHILELRIDDAVPLSPTQQQDTPQQVVPTEHPGIADSSILKLYPWSHIALNEGSFLKAYGTYEYFERGPPSLIHSIKTCLTSSIRKSRGGSMVCGAALRSFQYTAILPFANHVDFRDLLQDLDELDVKLAPDPDFPLTDKDRTGKAELEDCWQEFFEAYRSIIEPFRTFSILSDGTPKLKLFRCRDMNISALRCELDHEFTPLCLPAWTEPEPGVFVRHKLPPFYQNGFL